MWILECDGDILNNKRVWLRPGKTYLFGRTKPENSRYQTGFRINHKTVSRKHLVVTVAPSGPEDVGDIAKRSELTFEDAGTKAGTKIDGERITSGGRVVSSGAQHNFMLSSYQHEFRIRWKPVVLSFTFSSKDTKGGKDPLQPIHTRLAGLDIRAVGIYAATKTTHVVASKRNTARGLQALIQGAHIVSDEFVDAIVAGATPSDLDTPESFAPLEEDFDAAWPEDSAFLPPPGREPGPKDPELFEPDHDRVDFFQGMCFVFCDARQFEALQPPITDGGGKAVLFNLVPGQTTVGELKRFVKDTAGEHDDGELADDSRVVVVKFGGPKGYEDWSTQLQHDLGMAIGYCLLEQNEFLHAILTKDVSKLTKRIDANHVLEQSLQASSGSVNTDSSARQSEAPDSTADSKPAPPRRARGKLTSAFTGFDSGWDPAEVQPAPEQHSNVADGQLASEADGRPSRKRSPPDVDDYYDDPEVVEARMFPGAAAMKRRRLDNLDASGVNGARNDTRSRSRAATSVTPPVEVKRGKKIKQEPDINAEMRARREAWDARALEEEEGTMAGFNDMTTSQMKSLAVVESMDVSGRKPLAESNGQRENGRWREEWNGRKNFKKFRPQGEGQADRRQGQAVIVPLEEVRRKAGGGIGEVSWDSNTSRATHRYKQRIRSKWDDEVVEDSSEEDGPHLAYRSRNTTQRSKGSMTGDPANGDAVSDAGSATPVPEDIETARDGSHITDSVALRSSRSNGIATTQQSNSQNTRTLPLGNKRSATQSSSEKTMAPKRQRRLDESLRARGRRALGGSDDDDDDGSGDELKFRFRRRN